MYSTLTSEDIRTVTKATISALKKLELYCCLVGSVACFEYGTSRTPNDIDMVVLGCVWTQEELKRQVVATDSNFYTVASKDFRATYRVLYYRFPSSYTSGSTTSSSGYSRLLYTSSSNRRYGKNCKVDLLFPGIMNIPPVPRSRIYYKDNRSSKPLMPFLPLLLLKLQAWQDHGESSKQWMRAKQPTDVADITELLNVAVTKYLDVKLKNDEVWLPASFVDAAKRRVKLFTTRYPFTRSQWKLLGF
ncbi:hypothetical protein E1B28_005245 [Marasmius oreades]|uniref:Uncharacterized protein n=1 Tax=Marasmius oreades TaxID=181124 RepID=A0A9P8ADS9_9AGAR|nr:uncharacterized protein E1B28_005245 [Marasmius oreades]KAG7097934.1 hypothetical protein E1B28_005245 [Marasmius oreades]